MKRRGFILGGLVAVGGGVAVTSAVTLRWHARPRRAPKLTDAHLGELATGRSGTQPRVLFVGNSMTLRNKLPDEVAKRAALAGQDVQIATAAARGARLIETWRIDAFQTVLKSGWDVLVMQDFSTTCLRAPDRWASAYAMRSMAQAAGAQAVLLFPTWAFPAEHRVYQTGGGLLSSVPKDPQDFAACITAHYGGMAQAQGWIRAPITEAFSVDSRSLLEDDLHHPNPSGTARIADIVWRILEPMLDRIQT